MAISTIGLSVSLISGGTTFVGALPVLFLREISDRPIAIILGFGGGCHAGDNSFFATHSGD
ncbi:MULTISPECIES: hypothetical protein [unclassified Microcoleus]|uniref:hypothetical protein n=1 Tax=unclassified Microcoleus TaxID=2642155 RepID=UPI0025EA8066|nr:MULTISPECIES: hypothetical protein [unclassified Microcoleus]